MRTSPNIPGGGRAAATLLAAVLLLAAATSPASAQSGYYKDVFMDSGIMLNSRRTLPSADALGLQMEAFVSTKHTSKAPYPFTTADTLLQKAAFAGSDMDSNGYLLYPDGAPRFRMLYVNGGKAGRHGTSLGEQGRENIRRFVAAGGGYLGSCAGAFVASSMFWGKTAKKPRSMPSYLCVWPGTTHSTGLEKSWTDVDIPEGSPLRRYMVQARVDSVRHNGGCYAELLESEVPDGTEVLATFRTADRVDSVSSLHGKPLVWGLKTSPSSGRVVLCGSHPEEVEAGDRLDFMCAMVSYVLEGCPGPFVVKPGDLVPGQTRRMDRLYKDGDPGHARIGDRQYHFFRVAVPAGAESLEIRLRPVPGYADFDLCLFALEGGPAPLSDAKWKAVGPGASKTIVVSASKGAEVTVGVWCATTVDSVFGKYGTQYSGRVDVLEGVPYTLEVVL